MKDDAQEAVKQLEKAAKDKNKSKFAENLEKVASIAKSSAEIASIVLPFVHTAIQVTDGLATINTGDNYKALNIKKELC